MKRHSYYCRDKRGFSREIRMRSCVTCVKANSRCDTTRPSCARFVTRHISCSYPSGMVKPKASSNASPHWANQLYDVETMNLTTAASTTLSLNETAEPIEATLDFPDFSFASLGFGLPDWSLPERSDLGRTNKLGPHVPMLPRLGRRDRWTDHQPWRINPQGTPSREYPPTNFDLSPKSSLQRGEVQLPQHSRHACWPHTQG